MAKKLAPIQQRITEALESNGNSMSFADLARSVFPEADFPNAWRYSSNGGPPGCYMAVSAAIRRMGLKEEYTGVGPGNRIVKLKPSNDPS